MPQDHKDNRVEVVSQGLKALLVVPESLDLPERQGLLELRDQREHPVHRVL